MGTPNPNVAETPTTGRTLVRGRENTADLIVSLVERAARNKESPFLHVILDGHAWTAKPLYARTIMESIDKNPRFTVSILTDIHPDNVAYVKEMLKLGVRVRHIDDHVRSLVVSMTEALEITRWLEDGQPEEVVWSKDVKSTAELSQLFDSLWEEAIPADLRIAQLEEHRGSPKLEMIRDPVEIQARMLDLLRQATYEILMLFPTSNAFHREEKFGAVESLGFCASRGVKVSVLCPADSIVEQTIHSLNVRTPSGAGSAPISFRSIPQAKTRNTVTILVIDRKSSLVIEQRDDSQPDFERAIGVATYSTSNSTVLAAIRFFERLWDETEMRQREETLLENEIRSRRTAELLQDILSHDIRNYNEIAKLNAEVLREDPQMAPEDREKIFDALLRAIDHSSALIDQTRRLGRILSHREVELRAKDLEASFERSLSVVRAANPDRSINVNFSFERESPRDKPMVLADDLLDEAITNVLSNSVKYTSGADVTIEVELDRHNEPTPAISKDDGGQPSKRQAVRYWTLRISDNGRGIPDEMKSGIFSRYLETAKGSGLGLSIVRALVVDRYSGEVSVSNRVNDEYRKGTVVELRIPEARVDGEEPASARRT